ncbi:MAG: hypothetical protein VKL59_03975 [Nostocaceae cyanobacterium]|nr:hypothetical protein [Nostocaceae cyanobacterium]
MVFDISRTKTRFLFSSAILLAATALSGSWTLATAAGLVGGIAGNITADELREWMQRFRPQETVVNSQPLTEAVGLAMSLVILDIVNHDDGLNRLVEQKGLPYPHDDLRRFAKQIPNSWKKIASATAAHQQYQDIHVDNLVSILSCDTEGFKDVKVLDDTL